MSTEQDIEAIEVSITELKEQLDNYDALKRLHENKDFIRVILEGYFEKESTRLVMAKQNPALLSDSNQKTILTHIDSIGCLNQYFLKLRNNALLAKKTLEDNEVTREELLQEAIVNG